MKHHVPYGESTVDVEIEHPVDILLPNELEIREERELIAEALARPYGSETLEEFLYGTAGTDGIGTTDDTGDGGREPGTLLVVVNDGTRPTPSARIIRAIHPLLARHPDVKFIVATGAHRGPTYEEYGFIFGDHYEEFRERIFVHDARKADDMVHLGTSTNGTEMEVNRLMTEADRILIIGSVEPHYFAGYTGGRKSFLPGLASYRTIQMNHKLALSNRARSLALDGNPVHEDMMDALRTLEGMRVFSIQAVLTGDHRMYAVTAGDLHESFYAAVKAANRIFCVPLKKRGNIVITVAPYPMDVDLYQSQKAIDNGKFALRNGGVLIFVSRCADGIGGKTFFDLLSSSDTPQGVLYRINKEYKLGYHKAAKLAQIGVWAHMWGVTELPDDDLKAINITPYRDLQQAVDDAVELVWDRGEEPQFVLLPSGSLTIPILEERNFDGSMVRVKTDVGVNDVMEVIDLVLETEES